MRLKNWIKQRQEIASWYSQALQGIGDLILPAVHPNATHVYHLYVLTKLILTDKKLIKKIDYFLEQKGTIFLGNGRLIEVGFWDFGRFRILMQSK